MKRTQVFRSFVALAKVVGVGALLALSGQAAGQITSTKHNLGSTSAGGNNHVSDTGEICVFCHTPHGSDTTAPAPLWNKRLTTGASYSTYATLNSSTIDGQILSVGSVSLACLSCHDGSQAMDNIINAPGSGGYDLTGGGTNGLGYTWTGSTVNALGILQDGITKIGADLTNDHPIGIEYCGGGLPSTGASVSVSANCNDKDFKDPVTAVINTNRVWWIDTTGGTPSKRDKTDMILYTRNFAAGNTPSVECASCHDPHTNANPTFLRVSNTGSGVCLSCHVK